MSYYKAVGAAINKRNGRKLAGLLTTRDLRSTEKQAGIHALSPLWRRLVTLHVQARVLYQKGEYKQAFQASVECCDKVLAEVITSVDTTSNWWIPVVVPLATHLRLCSYKADQVSAAVNTLRRLMQLGNQDRNAPQFSKKQYILGVIVQLFKCFFKLNDYGQCKPLQRTLDNPGFPPLSSFPIGQVVAYKFYQGQLHVAASNYDQAKEALQFAFDNCPATATGNKRRILTALVPLNLLQRVSPDSRLLRKHALPAFYSDLVRSVRSGDLGLFDKVLSANQTFCISKGIFLIVEKLRQVCFMSVIRKVHKFLNADTAVHQIPIPTLQAACSAYGVAVDADELECVLVNLITADPPLIRGYIAHARCLVLAKQNPFPV